MLNEKMKSSLTLLPDSSGAAILACGGENALDNSLPDGFLVQDQLQHQHIKDTISFQ